MSKSILGHWRLETSPEFVTEMILRNDGSFDWRPADGEWLSETRTREGSPFPMTWRSPEEGTLILSSPIPPMPEVDMPDWTIDEMWYDILEIGEDFLRLQDKGPDDDMMWFYRRVE